MPAEKKKAKTPKKKKSTVKGRLMKKEQSKKTAKGENSKGMNQLFEGNGVPAGNLQEIPVEHLEGNPFQPRKHFPEDSLKDLEMSIRAQGVIQPITVRVHPEQKGQYQIIAGERRWRASKQAENPTVPAVIRSATDEEMATWAIIENVQREDLNPIDRAEALKILKQNTGWTVEKIAEECGFAKRNYYLRVALTDLPQYVREGVRRANLKEHHARGFVHLQDHPLAQSYLFDQTVEHQFTGGEVERAAKTVKKALSKYSDKKLEALSDDDLRGVVDNAMGSFLEAREKRPETRHYTKRGPHDRAVMALNKAGQAFEALEFGKLNDKSKAELRQLVEALLERIDNVEKTS